MKNDWFLALCDPHNAIIHEFGYDSLCNKTACVCLRNCSEYDHFQKNSQHKFINARQFYTIVGGVRERYTSFQNDFKQFYLKKYIQELNKAVSRFQEYILGDFLEKNPLVDIFCRYSSSANETVQGFITEQMKDLQFAELSCKEVNQLIQLEQSLQQETQNDQQKRITRLLSKVFQYYLRGKKLIDPPKVFDSRSLIDQYRIEDASVQMEKRLMIMDQTHNQKLQSVEELLIRIGEDVTQNKQEDDIYNRFYSILQRYLERVRPQLLTLVVRTPLVEHSFWQKLAILVQDRELKRLNVLTTCDEGDQKYLQNQLGKLKCMQTRIVYSAPWDQHKDELLSKR